MRDGYSEGQPDGRAFTKMSAGPAKARRLSSAGVRPVQGSLVLDFAQRATLERFWSEDLMGGVRAFYVRDQYRDGLPFGVELDGAIVGVLADADSTVLVMDSWWLARFGENGISYSPWGALHWQVSFTLEVLP